MRLVKEQIGRNIRRRRAELGINQVELARRAEVSLPEVSALEAGGREPLASTLQKIASALDWEASDVLDGVRWVVPDHHDDGHIERLRGRRPHDHRY